MHVVAEPVCVCTFDNVKKETEDLQTILSKSESSLERIAELRTGLDISNERYKNSCTLYEKTCNDMIPVKNKNSLFIIIKTKFN